MGEVVKNESENTTTTTSISSKQWNELFSKSSSVWKDPKYWETLCSSLKISEKKLDNGDKSDCSDVDDATKKISSSILNDGYTLFDFAKQDDKQKETISSLAAAIKLLSENNWPASMILLYDETWELARSASKCLSKYTNSSNVLNFDMLAWYIDASSGDSGFSPHRDRQPDDVDSSFHSDGHAKYVTLWLALTDATPENSCLYVIPKRFDPGFTKGDDPEPKAGWLDPLAKALPTKESYQNIRALPRNAGQAVLFTHRTMHWGSRGNSSCNEPRIALSFVASDPAFEKPYIDSKHLTDKALPSFNVRLLLVCSQMLIYYQRFNLTRAAIRTCYEYCKEHEDLLEPTYREKVYVEFVNAMKETAATNIDNPIPEKEGKADENNAVEDDEEVMLEQMLDAEVKGYGEFDDDFDEIEENIGEDEGNAKEEEKLVDDDDDNDVEGEVNLFQAKEGEKDDEKDDKLPAAKRQKKDP